MNVDIVEEVQAVVDKTRSAMGKDFELYYMYGHPVEIVTRLQEVTNSPKSKAKKFPLIVLFTDIEVSRNQPVGMFGNARLNLIIATLTVPTYTAPQRLENNFKPILQPIKEQFINQMERHRQFTYPQEITYTETERYYWGKAGLYGNTANMFNDYIDCIEINNLSLNIKNKIC